MADVWEMQSALVKALAGADSSEERAVLRLVEERPSEDELDALEVHLLTVHGATDDAIERWQLSPLQTLSMVEFAHERGEMLDRYLRVVGAARRMLRHDDA